jgi:hypothetical protein
LIGDSLMKNGVAPVLKKAIEAKIPGEVVENKARSATGLARPDYYDWPKTAKELLAGKKFETVVMLVGANDCQGIKDDKGKALRFDSPEWRAVYGERIKAMAALFCEDGRKAYWLGLPPMEKAGFDKRIKSLDQFIGETLAASGSCVKYLPVAEVLGNNGKFVSRLTVGKQKLRVREPDGIHITPVGGGLVADRLLEIMVKSEDDDHTRR